MDNVRGASLMVLAMLGFALEDMLIKQLAGGLPTGQIVLMLGFGGVIIFGAMAAWSGDALFGAHLLHPAFLLRSCAELFGTVGFVAAIALTPLSTVSAILQATPLAVTLGAALFLGETVGWRRWLAIFIGLCGVLLIIRPGTEAFDQRSLLAVMGVVGLAARDLATRRIPAGTASSVIACYAFLTMMTSGVILLAFGVTGSTWLATSGADNLRLGLAILAAVTAYYAIVTATRIGEMSAIAPYRYTRLVFALIIGVIAFGERPDALTLLGAAIIVTSGVYTLWREARLNGASKRTKAAL